MKGIYVITGTSRGIGAAVAARLLDTGNRVIGISRTPAALAGKPGYIDIQGSVTDMAWMEPMFARVEALLAAEPCDLLCLLNNAAMLEPIRAVETCEAYDIRQHIEVNLTAPIVLTARFMARFGALAMRKKVACMTSGAAHSAIPDMALYCTTKAGVSMFTACVGVEQEGRSHGFEAVAISPGMVETDMQKVARAKDADAFRAGDMFRHARASGTVKDADEVAATICRILQARTAMGGTEAVSAW